MKKYQLSLPVILLLLCFAARAQENADTPDRKLDDVVIPGIQNGAPNFILSVSAKLGVK